MDLDSSSDRNEQMEVVVINVTRKNLKTLFPAMMFAVQNSDYIAIDLELSGLGDRKNLIASSIDERFAQLCKIAKTRSVISCGLACFKQHPGKEEGIQRSYRCQVFNLFLLCDDEYIVESQSLRFLVKHGFDFNKQYALGIPYKKGYQEKTDLSASIRGLFLAIIMAKVPLIIHNGFIDLVFMYQCFYSDLPSSLQTFLADICEMFSAGVYDTKYISEYHVREKLSVLEYLFRKCQHKNTLAKLDGKLSIHVQSNAFIGDKSDGEVVSCILPSINITESYKEFVPHMCKSFQERGFCQIQNTCTKIHSIDLIIVSEDSAQKKKSKKRSRKRKRSGNSGDTYQEKTDDKSVAGGEVNNGPTKKARVEESEGTADKKIDLENDTRLRESFEKVSLPRMTGHRAGFDAFMTGYCYAFYQAQLSQEKETAMEDSRNRVYLTAKDMPLRIMKSHFVKTSSNHKKVVADLVKLEDP